MKRQYHKEWRDEKKIFVLLLQKLKKYVHNEQRNIIPREGVTALTQKVWLFL